MEPFIFKKSLKHFFIFTEMPNQGHFPEQLNLSIQVWDFPELNVWKGFKLNYLVGKGNLWVWTPFILNYLGKHLGWDTF